MNRTLRGSDVTWLTSLNKDPYFAAPEGPAMKAAASLVWKGWNMVTYPDQPVWSNTVGLVNTSAATVL